MQNPKETFKGFKFSVNDAMALFGFLRTPEGQIVLSELVSRRPTIEAPRTMEEGALGAARASGYELAVETLILMSQERSFMNSLPQTNEQTSMDDAQKETGL